MRVQMQPAESSQQSEPFLDVDVFAIGLVHAKCQVSAKIFSEFRCCQKTGS